MQRLNRTSALFASRSGVNGGSRGDPETGAGNLPGDSRSSPYPKPEERESPDALPSSPDEKEPVLRAIPEYFPAGIILVDAPDFRVRLTSAYISRLTGIPREEIEGAPLERFLERVNLHRPDTSAPAPGDELPLLRALRRGERVESEEWTISLRSGEDRSLLFSAEPVRDMAGNIVGGIGAWWDVTERMKPERALRESEERWERIIETADEGVWILDDRDRTAFLNGKLAGMFGYSMEEMREKSVYDFVDAEGRAILERNLDLRRQGHRGQYDIPFLRRDGSRMWAMVSANPIIDDQGKYRGSFAMITDISERKRVEEELRGARDELEERVWRRTVDLERAVEGLRAEIAERKRTQEALQKREQEFEALVENAPDIIARFDRDQRLMYVNHAVEEELGVSVTGIARKTLSDLGIPEDLVERLQAKLRAVFDTGREQTIETGFLLPEGWRWYYSRMAPVCAPDGSVESVLSISHNITGLKNAEEELRRHREHLEDLVEERTAELERSNRLLQQEITERRQAERNIRELNESLRRQAAQLLASNKELEAFSYSVSHDLRAPLRSIDGFSLALIEDYTDVLDDQGKDYLQRIRASTQRLGRLIDDLINISRVARSEMQHVRVNLSALAREIVTELRKSRPERRVEVTIHPNLSVRGDAGLLRQALENLLGNAWKFTERTPEAKIEFGIIRQDNQRVFFVRDNGAGFDMRYVDKLFLPFQRLHSREDFPGTGIGLAIVRRVIQRHGGRIWAEGEPDKGAVFYFTLQQEDSREHGYQKHPAGGG